MVIKKYLNHSMNQSDNAYPGSIVFNQMRYSKDGVLHLIELYRITPWISEVDNIYPSSVRVRLIHFLRASLHLPIFWSEISEGIKNMCKLMSW